MGKEIVPLCQTTTELINTYFPKKSLIEKRQARQKYEMLCKKAGIEKASIKLVARKNKNNVVLMFEQRKYSKRLYESLPDEYALNIEFTKEDQEDNRAKIEASYRLLEKRRDDLLLKGTGIISTKKTRRRLIEFIQELADYNLKKTGNRRSYYYILLSLAKHIEAYSGKDTRIKDVDIAASSRLYI